METQQTFEPSLSDDWYSPEHGKQVSEPEYWQDYYHHDTGFEWNNGILEEIPMPDEKSVDVYYWILSLIKEYLVPNPIERAMTLEMGFKIKDLKKVRAIR